MKTYWEERYKEEEYAYGIRPNAFFAACLPTIPAQARLLFPSEGEGRNAVFAAKEGYQVHAFDFSEFGKQKALQLALNNHVEIDYTIAEAQKFDYGIEKYDAIVLVYAHYPTEVRLVAHQKMIQALKKGGWIILEAFNPSQLQSNSFGPKDIEMLYSMAMLSQDFKDLNIEMLEEKTIMLSEGAFHHGKGEVVRMLARKN